jgi:hypothetical protein
LNWGSVVQEQDNPWWPSHGIFFLNVLQLHQQR